MNAIDHFIDELRAIPDNASNADGMTAWFDGQHPDILDAVGRVLAQHRRCGVVERLDRVTEEVHRLAAVDKLN